MSCSFLPGTLMIVATMAMSGAAFGQDTHGHKHLPITLHSRPVIERLPLRVVDPVDVALTNFGDTLVADRVGKVLFRIDSAGEASLIGRELDGLNRVVDSPQMGAHVLLASRGSGRIVRMTRTGVQHDVAYLPFVPAGLGANPLDGSLYTTNSRTGEVFRITAEGQRVPITTVSEPTKDLTVNAMGATISVLLKSGKVVSVGVGGSSETIGYVPATATRLTYHPGGFLVALCEDTTGKAVLLKPTDTREQQPDTFAGAPRGTQAMAFDKLGNLTLANPDLRAITRVTSRFQQRCDDCGKMMLIKLSTETPATQKATRRSF
ncbi:MAG: hypothetical protein ABGZ23_03080 [Fuerstiella sp.]|nr:hypothetical protein [Fuerstiella sp.]